MLSLFSSILIVLTVRHLAPKVPISVVVRAADNELLARQAGADNVINPVRFTGLLLAGSARGAHIARGTRHHHRPHRHEGGGGDHAVRSQTRTLRLGEFTSQSLGRYSVYSFIQARPQTKNNQTK